MKNQKVAKALDNEVVFVGGAMVAMYIDDPAAEDIGPTKDLDLTFKITTAGELEALREALIQKGFLQTHEDNVICRFLIVSLTDFQPSFWNVN